MSVDERYICTAETPWSEDKGRRSTHPDAIDLGNDSSDCCIRYRCPNCGHQWKQEMPQ